MYTIQHSTKDQVGRLVGWYMVLRIAEWRVEKPRCALQVVDMQLHIIFLVINDR